MSDDWRIYAVSVGFALWMGLLGGTRREEDRLTVAAAMGIAFLAGVGTLLFADRTDTTTLAATSLIVGCPATVAITYAVAALRSGGRRSPQPEPD